ncbi:MAG TPA: ATP-dependent Clp protease proteolytic subunit [Candidatus Saccharimonadales bacterium]|jgi:ATP-dependent Clp protease protease subunit|nr:ATP-dependent Clp protease proteolytic subunit [Candidatus Saccharimonadales bacterium]
MDTKEYFTRPRISLIGTVGDKMLQDLDRQISTILDKNEQDPIVVLATSGGGTRYGSAIYEELRALQQTGVNLSLVARGLCQSAGVLIAMAIPREQRFALPGTQFMIHDTSRYNQPHMDGYVDQRRFALDNVTSQMAADEKEDAWIKAVIAEGCGQTEKKINRKSKKAYYLIGEQAIRFGLIHSLVGDTSTH